MDASRTSIFISSRITVAWFVAKYRPGKPRSWKLSALKPVQPVDEKSIGGESPG